jgi:predicted phosphoadenosine phosphosulfate sulfurtransferase
MSKAEFILKITDLINDGIKVSKFHNNLYQLGINAFESDLEEIYTKTLKNYIELLFNNDEDKIDTFYWFLYEYMPSVLSKGKEMTIETAMMWDKNQNPICYNVVTLAEYLYD